MSVLQMQLKDHLRHLTGTSHVYSDAGVWILSVGMAAHAGSLIANAVDSQWFADQAYVAKSALGIKTWEEVLGRLEGVLWVRTWQAGVGLFRRGWDEVL